MLTHWVTVTPQHTPRTQEHCPLILWFIHVCLYRERPQALNPPRSSAGSSGGAVAMPREASPPRCPPPCPLGSLTRGSVPCPLLGQAGEAVLGASAGTIPQTDVPVGPRGA